MQPDKIKLLSPQQVAALGPAKVAALADVCVEWGPLSDTERARALAMIEPLDLGKLMSQKKVEIIANYWLFLPPAANKVGRGQARRRAQGAGHPRGAASSTPARSDWRFRWAHFAPRMRRRTGWRRCSTQGVKTAKVGQRVQAVQQTALVIRDPPAPAVVELKELQSGFPGSEVKIGTCEKTS